MTSETLNPNEYSFCLLGCFVDRKNTVKIQKNTGFSWEIRKRTVNMSHRSPYRFRNSISRFRPVSRISRKIWKHPKKSGKRNRKFIEFYRPFTSLVPYIEFITGVRASQFRRGGCNGWSYLREAVGIPTDQRPGHSGEAHFLSHAVLMSASGGWEWMISRLISQLHSVRWKE
jgi:hypothetical protein